MNESSIPDSGPPTDADRLAARVLFGQWLMFLIGAVPAAVFAWFAFDTQLFERRMLLALVALMQLTAGLSWWLLVPKLVQWNRRSMEIAVGLREGRTGSLELLHVSFLFGAPIVLLVISFSLAANSPRGLQWPVGLACLGLVVLGACWRFSVDRRRNIVDPNGEP